MILDVGCGAFPKGNVNLDCDIKTSFHHRGHIITKEIAKRTPNFVLGDAHNLPFKNNAFDFSLCFHTLEHLSNPIKALNELIRVTRGIVTIKVPHRYARPKRPSHINYFNKAWFRTVLKNHIFRATNNFSVGNFIPFHVLPLELIIEIKPVKVRK